MTFILRRPPLAYKEDSSDDIWGNQLSDFCSRRQLVFSIRYFSLSHCKRKTPQKTNQLTHRTFTSPWFWRREVQEPRCQQGRFGVPSEDRRLSAPTPLTQRPQVSPQLLSMRQWPTTQVLPSWPHLTLIPSHRPQVQVLYTGHGGPSYEFTRGTQSARSRTALYSSRETR